MKAPPDFDRLVFMPGKPTGDMLFPERTVKGTLEGQLDVEHRQRQAGHEHHLLDEPARHPVRCRHQPAPAHEPALALVAVAVDCIGFHDGQDGPVLGLIPHSRPGRGRGSQGELLGDTVAAILTAAQGEQAAGARMGLDPYQTVVEPECIVLPPATQERCEH